MSVEFDADDQTVPVEIDQAELRALLNGIPVEKPRDIGIHGIEYTKKEPITSLPTYLIGKVMPGA